MFTCVSWSHWPLIPDVLFPSYYMLLLMSSEEMAIGPFGEGPNDDYHIPFPWCYKIFLLYDYSFLQSGPRSEYWYRSRNSDQVIWFLIDTAEFSLLIMHTWFFRLYRLINTLIDCLCICLVPRFSCSNKYLHSALRLRPPWLPLPSSHSFTFSVIFYLKKCAVIVTSKTKGKRKFLCIT